MNFKHSLKTATTGLTTNKSRSFLTILGIVIGITAIIMVMSLGNGAQNLILAQIQGLGSRSIAIVPGRQINGPSDVAASFYNNSLKSRDLEALQKKINVPTLANATPILTTSETGFYKDQTYRLTLYGMSPEAQEIFDVTTEQGNFFTAEDVRGLAKVAVIGSKTKTELFGDADPIGKRIKIKNHTFVVVGVIGEKGQSAFINFDQSVAIPYSTMQQFILGIKYFNRIIAQADDSKNIDRTVNDIAATLRANHNITDTEKDDFTIETQVDLADRITVITDAFTFFLLAVAAISLIVGGVGIMNIMLVSVTERTREIGLRKAIGAKDKDIMFQFLLEAVTLTGVGGVIGIFLGSLFSYIISILIVRFSGLAWQFSFPYSAAIIGIVVSASIGLIFGLYPARQASKKSPMEALRYE
ncbi:MAG: ABC transporter permease [Parcubacteria group bacterium]|nr:ABC transporter permease [Parcubacteria group bacterium]